MEKKCPECGELIKGRIDKKFCSDLCRNAYNNKQNSDTTNYMRSVNNILRKNRRLLHEKVENGNGKANVHKDKLQEKGFNFKHITHTYKTKKGDTYYFCYEYGYLPLEKDFYFLVKWDAEKKINEPSN
jgi:predicted nucleic acid-binding Zn ribbon protein